MDIILNVSLKKILVIDKSNNFSKDLKSVFEVNYDDNYVSNLKNIEEVDLVNNDIVMLVLFELNDLFELMKIYNKPVSIIIASHDPEMLSRLNELNYTYLINLQNDISKVRIEINNCLNQINKTFCN